MKRYGKISFILCLLIISMTGCVNTDWKKARSIGTLEAYQEFLNKHPDSKYTSQAQKKIYYKKLMQDWQEASKENTLESYEALITKYRKFKGNHIDQTTKLIIKQAQEKIDLIIKNEFISALNKGSIDAYEAFLTKYPQAPQVETVKNRIKKLKLLEEKDWETTQRINTESSYQRYIKKYPESINVAQAKQNITKIQEDKKQRLLEEIKQWQQVKKENTAEAYLNFLLLYPESKKIKDLLSKLPSAGQIKGTIAGVNTIFRMTENLNNATIGMGSPMVTITLSEFPQTSFIVSSMEKASSYGLITKEKEGERHYGSQVIDNKGKNVELSFNIKIHNKQYVELIVTNLK